MLRSWLVGVFVLGLTGFCLVQGYWFGAGQEDVQASEDSENPTEAPGTEDDGSGVDPLEVIEMDGEPVLFPIADGEWAPDGAEAPPSKHGGDATEVGKGTLVASEGALDDIVLDFDFSVPGGAVRESPEENRARAREFVVKAHAARDDLARAEFLTKALLSGGLKENEDRQAYRSLLDVNRRGLFNPRQDHRCFRVTVRGGDSLWTICQRLVEEGHPPIEPGLIQLFNGLTNSSIYEGQSLKVPSDPLRIVIECDQYRLNALVGEILIRRFPVGLGKATNPTPRGSFKIATREKDPAWYKPGVGRLPFGHEENVLGTRWLGYAPMDEVPNISTFGIHGTWEPDSIGGNHSNGCVRMRNEDVETLFGWVVRGTRVEVR